MSIFLDRVLRRAYMRARTMEQTRTTGLHFANSTSRSWRQAYVCAPSTAPEAKQAGIDLRLGSPKEPGG